MVDTVDRATRSRMMSGIKGKNTKPEMIIRKYLHFKGLRFRLHRKDLPGRPDLVFPRYNLALFVHGCFWHSHPGCKYAVIPESNRQFWITKLSKNVERDYLAVERLMEVGWRVLVVWECGAKHNSQALDQVITFIKSDKKVESWPSELPKPKV